MNLSLIIQIGGVISLIVCAVTTRRLTDHIDPTRLREVSAVDPARIYSNIGPSCEVLSDRGRKLQALSFVLLGLGLLGIGLAPFFRHA